MKASDTVMPFSQIEAIDMKNAESNFTDALYDVAREQAEISFKAGYDEGIEAGDYCEGLTEGRHIGIKEVVDWIKEYSRTTYEHGKVEVAFNHVIWHSKLKEWGIE